MSEARAQGEASRLEKVDPERLVRPLEGSRCDAARICYSPQILGGGSLKGESVGVPSSIVPDYLPLIGQR